MKTKSVRFVFLLNESVGQGRDEIDARFMTAKQMNLF